jgi:hypothetical protein
MLSLQVLLFFPCLQDFFYEVAEKYRETAVFGVATETEILKNVFPTRQGTSTAQVVVLFNDDEDREEFVISDPSQKVCCSIHSPLIRTHTSSLLITFSVIL